MIADLHGILRGTDLLSSVPTADLEAVAAGSRQRTFRRGQILFIAGDPGDTVIVVISGRVKVVVRSADGGELTLAVIGPGGTFGELGAADAETLEECRLLFVHREIIQEICGRELTAQHALLRSISANLRRLTEAASDLVFLDLPRRVAKVLLSQPRGEDGLIWPPVSQEELAHQVGGSRPSVNATLRGFERRGWIQVRGRAVTVTQATALSRFAGT